MHSPLQNDVKHYSSAAKDPFGLPLDRALYGPQHLQMPLDLLSMQQLRGSTLHLPSLLGEALSGSAQLLNTLHWRLALQPTLPNVKTPQILFHNLSKPPIPLYNRIMAMLLRA